MKINRLKNFLINHFFSNYCPSCNVQISNKEPFCKKCYPYIELSNEKVKINQIKEGSVFNKDIGDTLLFTGYYYIKETKNILTKAKFQNCPHFYYNLTKSMSRYLKNEIKIDKNTLITYVPMPFSNQNNRGYNQAKVIAKNLADELNLKVKNLLVAKNKNKSQHSLKAKDRQTNVIDKFDIRKKKKINPSQIILVDDICTTASTLMYCTILLKKCYNCKVHCLAISKSYSNYNQDDNS